MEQGWSARESVFESMDGWMNEWMKPFTDCETASLPPSPDRCFSYSNLFPCSSVVAPQGVRILLLVGGGARPTLESWLVLFLNSFHGKGDPNDGKKREWTKGTRGSWRLRSLMKSTLPMLLLVSLLPRFPSESIRTRSARCSLRKRDFL